MRTVGSSPHTSSWAPPLLGLEQLEEADLVELGHRLVGQPSKVLRRLGALGDQRQQVVDAG
jgi:hypothetical protein